MITMTDLNRLREATMKIESVNKRLDSLCSIFANKESLNKVTPKFAGFDYQESIEVTTVFQSNEMTVTLAIFHKANVPYPEHCHTVSLEYLICTKGSHRVVFDKFTRVLTKGECVALPIGMKHYSVALEDESILLAICIPPEEAYLQCEEK